MCFCDVFRQKSLEFLTICPFYHFNSDKMVTKTYALYYFYKKYKLHADTAKIPLPVRGEGEAIGKEEIHSLKRIKIYLLNSLQALQVKQREKVDQGRPLSAGFLPRKSCHQFNTLLGMLRYNFPKIIYMFFSSSSLYKEITLGDNPHFIHCCFFLSPPSQKSLRYRCLILSPNNSTIFTI